MRNHSRQAVGVKKMIDNAGLLNSARRIGQRNESPPNWEFSFDETLNRLHDQCDIFRVGEIDWHDDVVDVTANRRQLARVCPLKELGKDVSKGKKRRE